MTDSSRRFDLLRLRYAESLPAKREALENAWNRFAAAPDEAACRDLQLPIHRLAGSAPAYGHDDLGEEARLIDAAIGEWLRGDAASSRDGAAFVRSIGPALAALLDALARASRDAAQASADGADTDKTLRVIVVEDDPVQAAMIAAKLEMKGCIVRIEHDSSSLGDALAIWPCHAVVVDFWLRDETATDAAAVLRGDAALDRVALVCFTIERDAGVLRAALDAGCDATVGKDEGIDRLWDALRAAVGRRNEA